MSEPISLPNLTLPEHPRYALVEKLAQGDYATVFRGRDLELNREVAIKQIHAQYLQDPRQLEVYWREAQLIASLEHPRIMTIYDLVRDRGWLILELMMGSIQQVLKGRPIDLTDLRFLLSAMAQGLQFLERNGIVHGDVKPSNMLVDKNRQMKLGDFGIARRLTKGEGSVVKGTAKYMAPEVVSDQFGEVGPHSDLYSLGFSAYELMCGSHFESLFPGLNMFGRDRQIAWMMWQSAPDRRLPEIRRVLQNVPDDLAHIIEKLCAKDPVKRYRSAEEVLRDLDKDKIRERKPTAQEAAETKQAALQTRRKRLLAVGALVVSLSLSVGLALLPSGTGPTPPPPPPRFEPSQGTLVLIELPNRLQIKTDDERIGDVPIDIRQDMIVLNEKELLNPEQLQNGDRVAVKRVESDGKVIQRIFAITRAEAVETHGLVAAVGLASRTITITPEGLAQNLSPVFVPTTIEILLNGAVVSLDAIQPGDRIVAKYLPDKGGLKAESVAVDRLVEIEGVLETIRLPSHLTVRPPDSPAKELPVDAQCRVSLNGRVADEDGRSFALADLRKDDRISLQHDRAVRRIDAQRVMTVTGTVERTDVPTKRLEVRQNDQTLRKLSLAEDCTIQLAGGEPVEFAELRVADTVTVVEDSQDGRARSILAVFAPDRHVWAIIIAQSRYDDRRLTPSEAVQPSAELLRRTLLRRVRVVQEQLLWLLDATRFGVEKPLNEFLKRIPAEGRLIVYYVGHAAINQETGGFLAPRDFDPSRPRETGLDLALVLKALDAAGQTTQPSAEPSASAASLGLDAAVACEKVFLFDVQHGGEDRRWQPTAEDLIEVLKTGQGRVARTMHVVGNCSRGQVDLRPEGAVTGIFATTVAAGLSGKADFDRNQRVTPQELFKYLKIEVPTMALRAGHEQTPVLFEPQPNRLTPEQRKALQELLAALRRGGKVDDAFALSYHRAATLIPDQPDAHLIYALAIMRDKQRSKLALDQFEQVIAKYPTHPHSILAYHAQAWLYFRNQDYDRGLQSLVQAISRVQDANNPYFKQLLAFTGQLSGFAHRAVADDKLLPRLSEVNKAVTAQGEPAQQIFRQRLDEVRAEVQRRDQEIQQASASEERARLELHKKNINTYADFEFPPPITFLEDALDSPR